METESKTNVTVGSSFLNLLTVAFIVLKIVNVDPIAGWSWWWIFAPLWIPATLFFVLTVFWGIANTIFR